MRYLFGFLCVCALGLMPLVGCSETAGTGGSGGDGGAGGEGGTGGMPECQSPEDCDDDNECTDDTCLAGVCEFMPVPDPTGPEQPGDPPGEGTTCGYYEGTCEGGSCAGTFACTEAGIREAIAAGAGPHTFDCNGPTTIVTEAPISIDNDVILDGEGNLMLDGESAVNNLFTVPEVVTAELHGFTVTGGGNSPCDDFFGGCAGVWNEGTLLLTNGTLTDNGSGVLNTGTLTMTDTAASENEGYGILNRGEPATLTVTNSTLSGNVEAGIFSELGQVNVTASTISGNGAGESDGNGITLVMARLTITNSTVSDNLGIGIDSGQDIVTVTHSTISGNGIGGLLNGGNDLIGYGAMTVTNSIVDDNECEGPITSNGYNIESPGNSCGFDQGTDQVDLTEGELNLAPLADNGGPTMTHALLTEPVVSVAVDVIPADDCVDAEGELLPTDQRGEPRFVGPPFGPSEPVGDGCDVGAFEVQP